MRILVIIINTVQSFFYTLLFFESVGIKRTSSTWEIQNTILYVNWWVIQNSL